MILEPGLLVTLGTGVRFRRTKPPTGCFPPVEHLGRVSPTTHRKQAKLLRGQNLLQINQDQLIRAPVTRLSLAGVGMANALSGNAYPGSGRNENQGPQSRPSGAQKKAFCRVFARYKLSINPVILVSMPYYHFDCPSDPTGVIQQSCGQDQDASWLRLPRPLQIGVP